MKWLRRALALAGIVLAGSVPAQVAAPAEARLPVELFAAEADFQQAKLSPSGRWLAFTALLQGRVTLVVYDVASGKPASVAARFSNADIDEFHWVSDERLVLDLRDRLRGGGEQRFAPGLFSVQRDGREVTRLIDTDRGMVRERRVGRDPLPASHSLLHVPRGGPEDVVIVGESLWLRGEPAGVVAKRLDVRTGRTEGLSRGQPEHVRQWIFDAAGEPRLVTTLHQGQGAVYWREGEGWRRLFAYQAQGAPWWPHSVDADGRLYVLAASGVEGERQLHRYDFATGQPEREPLVATPGFDFAGRIVTETAGGRALGVTVETDAARTVWFDERLRALQQEADRRLPGRINVLTCRRCDAPDMTVLVQSYADRVPGDWVVYTAADQRWRAIASRRPKVDPARMATLDFERFTARDGRSIPVWVTRPDASVASRTAPQPTVVLVHGGPWVRGVRWAWNADAQFLASRGYVVVEPEFRGSTGYGQSHFRAGWRQWGQAMQDDIADATQWAVKQGLADRERICIAGASYGGYATLMGLVRHGELYRCGVAWVAVSDLRLLYRWSPASDSIAEWRHYSNPQLIGDPDTDKAMLEGNSPVLRAGEIRRPLLLAMGGADRRVPLEHGEAMRDALAKAGRAVEWVVYPEEGHGWNLLQTRVDFYQRMERFLAEHLR